MLVIEKAKAKESRKCVFRYTHYTESIFLANRFHFPLIEYGLSSYSGFELNVMLKKEIPLNKHKAFFFITMNIYFGVTYISLM